MLKEKHRTFSKKGSQVVNVFFVELVRAMIFPRKIIVSVLSIPFMYVVFTLLFGILNLTFEVRTVQSEVLHTSHEIGLAHDENLRKLLVIVVLYIATTVAKIELWIIVLYQIFIKMSSYVKC